YYSIAMSFGFVGSDFPAPPLEMVLKSPKKDLLLLRDRVGRVYSVSLADLSYARIGGPSRFRDITLTKDRLLLLGTTGPASGYDLDRLTELEDVKYLCARDAYSVFPGENRIAVARQGKSPILIVDLSARRYRQVVAELDTGPAEISTIAICDD